MTNSSNYLSNESTSEYVILTTTNYNQLYSEVDTKKMRFTHPFHGCSLYKYIKYICELLQRSMLISKRSTNNIYNIKPSSHTSFHSTAVAYEKDLAPYPFDLKVLLGSYLVIVSLM